jgi:hypothetical protein
MKREMNPGVRESGKILDPLLKYRFSRKAVHHGVN